jgi:pimeloyl-ACP methyl ester carboxylesterase
MAFLLANMSIGGQKQWNPLVAAVNPQKFTTVTFDYRAINDVSPDMQHILGWLRQEGFERVICIGASLGTQACSSIALEPETAGIVLIAGSVHYDRVAEAVYPKLFIAAELDPWAFNMQTGYERAAEPKELVLFEANRTHGTDLFSSANNDKFLTLLLDFIDGLAPP